MVSGSSNSSVQNAILQEYPALCQAPMLLNFSDFESRIILKLYSITKGVASPKSLRNVFQSLLMFYYIIELSRSLYLVSIMQKYI